MMILLLKQVLRTSQHDRETASIYSETVVVKADQEEVTQMKLQMVAFSKQLLEKDKRAQLGPPHLYNIAGLLLALVTRRNEIGGQNHRDITELKDKYDKASMIERHEMCRMCKVEKCTRWIRKG